MWILIPWSNSIYRRVTSLHLKFLFFLLQYYSMFFFKIFCLLFVTFFKRNASSYLISPFLKMSISTRCFSYLEVWNELVNAFRKWIKHKLKFSSTHVLSPSFSFSKSMAILHIFIDGAWKKLNQTYRNS